MKTSDKGIALVKQSEGLRLTAYRDAVGIWTIGYGHTGPDVVEGRTITTQQAEDLIRADLVKFENAVLRLVDVHLNQNQFDALVCFSYNVGSTAFAQSTLLKKLNDADYAGAADQFLRWDKAGGKVLSGLTKRRQAERALFLS